MTASWEKVMLGRTGVKVCPIGLGASYGIDQADVERAIDRGVNFLYWGSMRKDGFGRGIASRAKQKREDLVVVVQSYTRAASLMRGSLERALRKLGLDYADCLLLGWWNSPPPRRILDAALALKEAGKARHIMVSCHDRPTFAKFIADPAYGAIMVRYNAAHPGAEKEVFPVLGDNPPGVIAYTATRWGQLPNPRLTPKGESTPRGSDCYRFALSHPKVDLVLSGPKDAAELDEALAALDRGPMTDDELAWMKRVGSAIRSASVAKTRSPVALWHRLTGMFSGSPD